MTWRHTLLFRAATGLVTLVSLASPTFAQAKKVEERAPFDVGGLPHEDTTTWVPWVFAALFAILAGLIAFKNPHRSHLD